MFMFRPCDPYQPEMIPSLYVVPQVRFEAECPLNSYPGRDEDVHGIKAYFQDHVTGEKEGVLVFVTDSAKKVKTLLDQMTQAMVNTGVAAFDFEWLARACLAMPKDEGEPERNNLVYIQGADGGEGSGAESVDGADDPVEEPTS